MLDSLPSPNAVLYRYRELDLEKGLLESCLAVTAWTLVLAVNPEWNSESPYLPSADTSLAIAELQLYVLCKRWWH